MNWEQKLQACQSLCPASLCMREPGDWYVDQRIEVKDGCILKVSYGNGQTPQEAVENHWRELTDISPDQYLVINAGGKNMAAYRWHGFMWKQVKE